jgi:hypothetical protein
LETNGPLGTLWAGLAVGAFFFAVVWVNMILAMMITPLFLVPLTWLQDAVKGRKRRPA